MILTIKDPPISLELSDSDLIQLICKSFFDRHGAENLEDAIHNFIKGLWDECEVLVPTEDS